MFENPGEERGSSTFSMRIDVVRNILGDIGPYQICICIFLYLSKISVAHQTMVHFLYTIPGFPICKSPSNVENPCSNECDDVQYEHPLFNTTVFSEWNLACRRATRLPRSFLIMILGSLLGGMFFGYLADRLGRRPLFLTCCMLMLFASFFTARSPWYWFFCVFRFLCGAAGGGITIISFVILVELTSGRKRELVTILLQVPHCIGQSTLALFAHFHRNWRTLQVILAMCTLIHLLYFCLIPESPRWLLITGRLRKCAIILEQGAVRNSRRCENIHNELSNAYEILQLDSTKNANLSDLFRLPNLRRKTFLMATIWFAGHMMYYGIMTILSTIQGNVLAIWGICGAMGVAAAVITLPITNYFGRRMTLCIANGLCALSLFLIACLPSGPKWVPAIVFCAILSLMSSNITFANTCLYSAELFPTVLRNSAIGFCFLIGGVGTIVGVFVSQLQDVRAWLPPLIYGLVALSTLALAPMLPETKQLIMLPETLHDGENVGQKDYNFILEMDSRERLRGRKWSLTQSESDSKRKVDSFDTQLTPKSFQAPNFADQASLDPQSSTSQMHNVEARYPENTRKYSKRGILRRASLPSEKTELEGRSASQTLVAPKPSEHSSADEAALQIAPNNAKTSSDEELEAKKTNK